MPEIIQALVAWSVFILDPKTRRLLSACVVALLDLTLEMRSDASRHCVLETMLDWINCLRDKKQRDRQGSFVMTVELKTDTAGAARIHRGIAPDGTIYWPPRPSANGGSIADMSARNRAKSKPPDP